MNEGYYEEPMKWTIRSNDDVYENERTDRADDSKKRQWGIYEWPKITNTTILLTVVGSSVISLISLIALIQASNATDNDLAEITRILSKIRINITSTRTPPILITTTEPPKNETCKTLYGDKCFHLVTGDDNLTLADARNECIKMKARLANIYGLDHFKQISMLLKNSIMPGAQGISAWTGMTVNGKARRMVLTDFRQASSEIPWYPGRFFASKLPYLGIKVRSTTNLYAHGMYDARSSERFRTALCETETKPCKNEI